MLPWTEIVKKETWVYNLKPSDYKHQLPTDHVEFSNKKCEVIHSNKEKNYQKSHIDASFQRNIWFFWILIKFSTIFIKTLNFVNLFYIFLFLIFYLHFFAFLCTLIFTVWSQTSWKYINLFSKHWVLDNMADFLFRKIQEYKYIQWQFVI